MQPTNAPPFLGIGDTVCAAYVKDAALAPGDLVNGADLRYGPEISYVAMLASQPTQPAFPLVVGSPLPGAWRAQQGSVSATAWAQGGALLAVMGYFTRVS